MITQQLLKKPKHTSIVEKVREALPLLLRAPQQSSVKPTFDTATSEWVFPDGSRKPLGYTATGPQPINNGPLSSIWTKHHYSLYIEGVKEKFKVGDYVTHRKNAITLNWCPLAYKIVEIGEIRHLVKWDMERNLPKPIGVVLVGTETPTYWASDDTRLLTEDEKKLSRDIQKELGNDNISVIEEEFPTREHDAITNPNKA